MHVSHLGDLYGVVLLVFLFLSKIEILPFVLWFPCAVPDLTTQIRHKSCFEEIFMAHLKYECIYIHHSSSYSELHLQVLSNGGKWWLCLARLLKFGEACCPRACATLPWVWLAVGFALAGPGPGRAQSAPLAHLCSGEKPSSASMDLSLCTFAAYQSSE